MQPAHLYCEVKMNNKSNPKVSICIPTYNQPTTLACALQSLAEQDFTDLEVIITDDSTKTSVEQVVTRFQSRLSVKYYKNQTTLGPAANWNLGMELSRGDYVKILHHDDWLADSHALTLYVDLLDSNPIADFAFSATNVYDQNREYLRTHQPTERQLRSLGKRGKALFYGNCIGSPSATIFRRTAKARFDPNLKWLIDVDFYLQFLTARSRFAYAPAPLICTLSGADHNLTATCVGQKNIDLAEWMYLYRKYRVPPTLSGIRRMGKHFHHYHCHALDALPGFPDNNPTMPLVLRLGLIYARWTKFRNNHRLRLL